MTSTIRGAEYFPAQPKELPAKTSRWRNSPSEKSSHFFLHYCNLKQRAQHKKESPTITNKTIIKILYTMCSLGHHLQEAIRRNNEGAQLIRTDHYDEAITMMTSALEEFRRIRKPFSSPQEQDDDDEISTLTLEPTTLQQQQQDDEVVDMSIEEDDDDDESGFLYRSPIEIPHDDAPTDDSIVSFILIFNLSLAYHLKGVQATTTGMTIQDDDDDSHSVPALLRKCITLYELAYQILANKPDAFGVRVSLILSNNLGQALLSMEDHDKADECFSRLLSTVMYLKDIGMEEELDEIDGFLQSTSHLVLKQPTAAAA